jgi:radical SAM protein with 4Fe4S-binding SPASM domain
MLEPFNINKYAKKDPEDILYENLYEKFGDRFSEYRKRYSDNIKRLDLDKKTKFPNTVILELVNRCDLECVMCYQGFRNNAKKSTLDENLLDKIFSEFKKNKLNSLMLSASEPLLYKNIGDVLERARKAEIMDIFIFTNGTLLNEKNAKILLNSPLTRLFISIDGATKETYDKVRVPVGKGLYKKNRLEILEKNILRFIELRDKKNVGLPLVRTSFVALKQNKKEIDMFIKKWQPIVDHVDIQKNVIPFFELDEMKKLEEEKKGDDNKLYQCHEPWGQVSIYSDGTVAPCCTTFGRNLPIGNMHDQTLEEIWNGEKMSEIREGFKNNKPHLVCKTCINNSEQNIT